MLTLEEFIAIIVLLSVFIVTSFAVFCSIYEAHIRDYNNEKRYSISKTQKDIEKRLKKVKKVKLCQKR